MHRLQQTWSSRAIAVGRKPQPSGRGRSQRSHRAAGQALLSWAHQECRGTRRSLAWTQWHSQRRQGGSQALVQLDSRNMCGVRSRSCLDASGPSRGRRWRTATLNEALLLRLAAEFQGFARDLHEQTCDTFAAWIIPSDPTVKQVVRKQLADGRQLERGNANPVSIGSDWRRDLDGLTANLDGEIAAQLGRLFQRQSPW